jgi:plasmid replication initiation protein
MDGTGALVPVGGARAPSAQIIPAGGFFLCEVASALPKSDLGTLEHPVFSLATRPDRRVLRYQHGPVSVEVTPSVKGRATIHDKDVLIYCVSQLMAALNAGRPVGRTLRMRAADLMAATRRESSGDGYQRLREALERLAGTRITTNVVTGGVECTEGFGLIEGWRIVRRRGGRMASVAVTLSEWLFRAVLGGAVLTLSRDYFGLRRPLERRLYELCRKHCGRQPEWRVGLETLMKKTGSASPRRVFRRMLREVALADRIPEYRLAFEDDLMRVSPRGAPGPMLGAAPAVSAAALERARAMAPGWDVHALEAEWRGFWERTGRARLRAPDAAFLGWLAKRSL